MDYTKISPGIIEVIREYADQHHETGGFLRAVLSNDLAEAVGIADEDNLKVLPEIVAYCYNEIPSMCWGTSKKVKDWLDAGHKGGK